MKRHHREDILKVGVDDTGNISSEINVTGLTADRDPTAMSVVVVGSVTGFFLILLFCVIVLLVKSKMSRKRSQELFHFDSFDDSSICKSAPISRTSSPKLQKRLSCPNAYGTIETGSYVQTSVFDYIPSEQMPPQPIQPKLSDNFTGQSSSSLHTLHVGHPEQTAYHSENELFASSRTFMPDTSHTNQSQILFTALYDVTGGQLVVTLVKVNDLAGRPSSNGPRDPFVKIMLLPDECTCQTSRTVRQSLNPVFNETFTFNVHEDTIKSKCLKFSVYEFDKRRVRHALGHVTVPLSDVDITSSAVNSRNLDQSVKNGCSSSGEINIGLTYLPHLEKMKVIVLRVRNIRPNKHNSGLTVRLQQFYGNKPVKVKSTMTQRMGEDTNFNESFAFSTSNRNIENFHFTVTVYETSRDGTFDDVELGHVNLGSFMFARGDGLIHWQEMLAKTRNVVSKWHPLVLQI